ncbi:histidine phosphatase family protein [Lysinibacillus sp. SGAir0095]|uniref:histidine phosphatase family protein n=1 Tax=Lysinibacillus sp. SGAir0095 TaxID=2070463 RepID=UPI0010CCDD1F|nr:histidine phosphatase family protein [Lysinibacillus sp. SGAir0095]QCR31182.1 histidine phosphatase family protein [Lysinibacillus sp. SGAir0095]
MLTNLYFVRHAHSIYTPDELRRPLSEKGCIDAEKIRQALENENIDIVISSPYKRAIQTVEGIANVINMEVILEEDFKERTLSIEPVEDFNLAITKVWENATFSWPGGESNIMAQKRGIRAMDKLLNTYAGKNVAIGTHGNIMVLIMNYFDKKYNLSFWENLDMPDIYKLTFDNKVLKDVKRIWSRSC